MVATEHPAAFLQAVADDAHAAMRARGRQPMDRTFKAVKRVSLTLRNHLKGFVVVVAARVAFRHVDLLLTVTHYLRNLVLRAGRGLCAGTHPVRDCRTICGDGQQDLTFDLCFRGKRQEIQSCSFRASGLDGRTIRKVVANALASRREVAVAPAKLTPADLQPTSSRL